MAFQTQSNPNSVTSTHLPVGFARLKIVDGLINYISGKFVADMGLQTPAGKAKRYISAYVEPLAPHIAALKAIPGVAFTIYTNDGVEIDSVIAEGTCYIVATTPAEGAVSASDLLA